MSVLTTITQTMIEEAQAEAKRLYMNRVGGYDIDIQSEPDRHGNFARKYFRGARVEFTATGINEFLDMIFEKISQGYKRCDARTTNLGIVYFAYLEKPDTEIAADLAEEFVEVEESLRASVHKSNEAIIATTVAQRRAQILKEREQAIKTAEAELEAELDREVRTALSAYETELRGGARASRKGGAK